MISNHNDGTLVMASAAEELDGVADDQKFSQPTPVAESQHRPQATAFFAQGLPTDGAVDRASDENRSNLENAINSNKSPLIVDLSMDVSQAI